MVGWRSSCVPCDQAGEIEISKRKRRLVEYFIVSLFNEINLMQNIKVIRKNFVMNITVFHDYNLLLYTLGIQRLYFFFF
jgi:hypothetical protein